MGYEDEFPEHSEIDISKFEKEEAKKLDLIDTIVYADFKNKILVGKCKAKDFKR